MTDSMRFRFHRGSLADSMTTAVLLEPTMEALRRHVDRYPCYDSQSLEVKYYFGKPDERCGWGNTFIVTDHAGPVGFTNRMPEGE